MSNLLEHMTLSVKGQNSADGTFDWKNAFVDAGILTVITVSAGLAVAGSDGGLAVSEVCNLLSAAGVEFFGFLAVKRGLKKTGETSEK